MLTRVSVIALKSNRFSETTQAMAKDIKMVSLQSRLLLERFLLCLKVCIEVHRIHRSQEGPHLDWFYIFPLLLDALHIDRQQFLKAKKFYFNLREMRRKKQFLLRAGERVSLSSFVERIVQMFVD